MQPTRLPVRQPLLCKSLGPATGELRECVTCEKLGIIKRFKLFSCTHPEQQQANQGTTTIPDCENCPACPEVP